MGVLLWDVISGYRDDSPYPSLLQSLALAHLNIDAQDNVVLSTWTETDFR